MVAFVNVSITFNNQIILAGLLENTTGMPIPQKTADKAFKLTDENFTHIVFNPLHKNGRHKLAISRRRHRKINDTECVLTMTTEINIRRPGFEQFDKLHMFTADRF